MVRDRDSPVEYTGEAHLVGVSCGLCDESMIVPESNAEYKDENDKPHVCSECLQSLDDLWSDLYIREPIRRLRIAADYTEAHGKHTKANMLRAMADEMEKWEPVVRGFDAWKSGNFGDLESAVKRYENND